MVVVLVHNGTIRSLTFMSEECKSAFIWMASYSLRGKKKGLKVRRRSVLGPPSFLLHVTYIFYSSNKLNFFLFADDANHLCAD